MNWHTCESLLNTLLGTAVEQLAGCLAKQANCKAKMTSKPFHGRHKVTPIAPPIRCGIWPVPNRNLINFTVSCGIIGASVSEPPSSDTNGTFFYIIIYIYVSYVVPHILNLSNLTYVTSINTYSADAMCFTMESYSNSLARVPESSENREDRLQRRRERERARRASETVEQREERLRVRRARDRARRAAQTAEERDARLRQIRDNRRQSLATESEEKRAARLQQMSANQRHRLASETEEERATRLRQMSANQCHRLATETEE